jgi:aminopeptidase N
MKNLLMLACLLSAGVLSAQMMVKSAEWCATGKQNQAAVLLLADQRSDSIDILHTAIALNIAAAPLVSARCALTVKAKMGPLSQIRLDLEGYQLDSVRLNQVKTNFNYVSPSLTVLFATPLSLGQTANLEVFYHGTGPQDPSGWGGIYNQGAYFYNLGVGFDVDPHSYGRAWFPCFDNFVERSTFEVDIRSLPGRNTYSNGYLFSETLENGLLHRIWRLDHPIPSYLACFSTGPYVSFKRTYPGENGPIPVEIAASANDTAKVAGSFVHLPEAIRAFEHWYGPFAWNKIGYSLVPFQSGAMEHATNISIMQSAIVGNTTNETLWAHELSHHWWGDLATCSTAEDMWLNEGWAVFSEHLFTEWLYGKTAYNKAVQTNFLNVLENAHITEGMYRAVSGVPHEFTYGTHVYNKGASVAYNLRTYMGDSLFRLGCRAVLSQTQFTDWSSAELRDKMSAATGVDLQDFFNDWVFSPGFSHFSVDSFEIIASPNPGFKLVKVHIQQKLRGAPHLHQKVPLDIVFVNQKQEKLERSTLVSGQNTEVQFLLPQNFGSPVQCWVDPNLKLLIARSESEQKIKAPGQYSFAPAKMDVKVNTVSDSALMRVEYHYVMPDTGALVNPQGYKLSNRYWSVEGVFPANFQATTNLFYDGRGQQDQLDAELFAQTGPSEDSVIVVYRPKTGLPWSYYGAVTKKTLSSTTDRYGFFRIDQLIPGQYTIAKGSATSGIPNLTQSAFALKISPNPVREKLQVESEEPFDRAVLIDQLGQTVQTWTQEPGKTANLQIAPTPSGTYWLQVYGKTGISVASLVILR